MSLSAVVLCALVAYVFTEDRELADLVRVVVGVPLVLLVVWVLLHGGR